MKLDTYDRKILAALQRNGRLSNVELAEEIGLSASPCLRRVRMLEEAGVIRGYQANLDRDEVGLGLTVFVGVKVERHNEERAEAFYAAVTALPEVVPDLRAYDRFVSGHLLKLPGVSDIRSNFAIHTVKAPGALPLGHLPL
jgi:Lrp/AsnC family transcriptional regulator, leucine-responsive regulatory protein